MQGIALVLGAVDLPTLAGLILALGITALACSLYVVVETLLRADSIDWGTATGGVVVALAFGALGAFLALLGLPTFG